MFITKLKENEVFVFGSNEGGFHGEGAAAYAFRFDSSIPWRRDPFMLAALDSPKGSRKHVGKWAILGTGRGYMEGQEGKSYAISTVKFISGKRYSLPLDEIESQISEFIYFAKEHPELTFLVTPVGTGYAQYSKDKMSSIWSKYTLTDNIKLLY